jgi:hypothetical protein
MSDDARPATQAESDSSLARTDDRRKASPPFKEGGRRERRHPAGEAVLHGLWRALVGCLVTVVVLSASQIRRWQGATTKD